MLKGQVETIVSFHIQNISNSKAERNTVPLVGNTCMWVGREMVNVLVCVWFREMGGYLRSEISFRVEKRKTVVVAFCKCLGSSKEELKSCNIWVVYFQPIAHAELAQKQGVPAVMLEQNRFLHGQNAAL